MKNKILLPILASLLVLTFFQNITLAQDTAPPRVEIPGSQTLKLTSSLTGQEYLLYVHLPGGYAKDTDKSYPVVYLLDGQYDFPMLTGVYGGQYYDGYLPAFIIVGITWGGKDPDAGLLRGRDFSPTKIEGMESGGAPKFFDFIKKEMIPFVGSKFRVTDDRTLIGSSFGGLFTLYALFNDPSLFHRYVLTSPSLGWDNFILRTFEEKYSATGSSTPVKLFMGIGSMEPNVPEFQKFATRLKEKKIKGLEFETLVMANTGHAGTKPEGFARGLQYVFERPSLKLPTTVLDRYAGAYQVGNQTVTLGKEEGKLVANVPGGGKFILDAESEKDFYAKGQFLTVHFQTDAAGKVTGFQLDQFGGGMFIKKIN